jgi:PAS domain S-box-containing protein
MANEADGLALLELGREVAAAASEEQLVAVVAKGIKGLFPSRPFCLRVVDTHCALTSFYAEGRLLEGRRELLAFKRSAAAKTLLVTGNLPAERVHFTEEDVPLLFEGSARSICAPLVASGQLFGVINVEYPPGTSVDLTRDDRVLVQLANTVAVGVRNAKLIDELTFLRKYTEELLENANALILVVDRARRVRVFNKKLVNLTEHARDEVLGRDLLSFVPETERLRLMRILTAALRGEHSSNVETRLLGRTGQEVRVSFSTSSAVTVPGGDVEGVIVTGQDLTQVRELERRVVQAEKLASLGQLAASVAHEVNNPMTAICAYTDSLLQSAQLEHGREAETDKLRKIQENSERILRFTRDLVSYSRPQDKPEPTDLHATLDLAVRFCDHLLVEQGVEVQRAFSSVPRVPAVRSNLVQVFVNLITNACHALPEGGRIRLETASLGGDVRVKVADNGIGIDPTHLSKVFDPFFTTKPDGKGTGLGLSIVQSIIQRHGGDIRVESQLGEGTVFSIRLPSEAPLA